jgi:hypothetical protein
MLPTNAAARKSEFSWATGRYPGTCARAQWGGPFCAAQLGIGTPERRTPRTPEKISGNTPAGALRRIAVIEQLARSDGSHGTLLPKNNLAGLLSLPGKKARAS